MRTHLDAADRAKLRKHLAERFFGHVLRQPADMDVGRQRVAGVVRSGQDWGVFAC